MTGQWGSWDTGLVPSQPHQMPDLKYPHDAVEFPNPVDILWKEGSGVRCPSLGLRGHEGGKSSMMQGTQSPAPGGDSAMPAQKRPHCSQGNWAREAGNGRSCLRKHWQNQTSQQCQGGGEKSSLEARPKKVKKGRGRRRLGKLAALKSLTA